MNRRQEGEIEVLTEVEATGLNTSSKSLSLSTGQLLRYDKLVLATGSSPRTLDVKGKELENILVR